MRYDSRDFGETMDTERQQGRRNSLVLAAVAGVSLIALSLIGQNYPLFHTVIELMVAVVALAVFLIAWHTRTIASSDYLTFIGMASLPVGAVTILHALAYTGMPVFPGYDTNLPTQLWVIARTLQGSAFLIGPVFLVRRLNMPAIPLAAYCIAATAAVWAAFSGVFPAAFVQGQGLTPFKLGMELLVITMTIAGGVGLYLRRDKLAADVARLLWASMACTVIAETAFTLYNDPFGPANRAGHAAHLAAFLLIYGALVQTSLERPLETLFRQLKLREAELAEAYAVDHEIAETLQDAMAIAPIDVLELQVAHRYIPAPGVGRIGGDFYDVFPIRDGLVGFVIGDVCGKGIRAAMTTMKARSALRAVALTDHEPSDVLERINAYLWRELQSDSFVTAVFGTIHVRTGHVHYAVAGHPEPIVCPRPEAVPSDGHHAPPLGVGPKLHARTQQLVLQPGESLILVTDGVLEAGGSRNQFGEQRLAALVRDLPCERSAADIVDGLLNALKAHAGGVITDDVAIVALQRTV